MPAQARHAPRRTRIGRLTGMPSHAREKPRPIRNSAAGGRRAWRSWQGSRPFSGALIVIVGGAEILATRLAMPPAPRTIHPVGMLIAGGIVACGLLLLFGPAQRTLYATAAILLAISALTTAHLGGYLLGTILGAAGGAVAFAWVPSVPAEQRVRPALPGFTLIRGEAPDPPDRGLEPVGPEPITRPELVRPEAVRPEVVRPEWSRPEPITRPDMLRPELTRPRLAGRPEPAGRQPRPGRPRLAGRAGHSRRA